MIKTVIRLIDITGELAKRGEEDSIIKNELKALQESKTKTMNSLEIIAGDMKQLIGIMAQIAQIMSPILQFQTQTRNQSQGL